MGGNHRERNKRRNRRKKEKETSITVARTMGSSKAEFLLVGGWVCFFTFLNAV